MRAMLVALGTLILPAVATATSPAICGDQEVNFVQESTIGVGCPIYAVNPTLGVAEVRAQINAGGTAELTPASASPLTVTVSTTRCNPDICEDETTLQQRPGELLRFDLPMLQVGDIVQLTAMLDGYYNYAPRLRVTEEACGSAPTTVTVAACTGTCDYVEACDARFGCAAGPAHGAAGSWALPLFILGVAMACGLRRTKRPR